MSKGDILRGFVSERLAIATQEILGVVDKLVAGYEEEASGFRREIERQKRELEVLLQGQQGSHVIFYNARSYCDILLFISSFVRPYQSTSNIMPYCLLFLQCGCLLFSIYNCGK